MKVDIRKRDSIRYTEGGFSSSLWDLSDLSPVPEVIQIQK